MRIDRCTGEVYHRGKWFESVDEYEEWLDGKADHDCSMHDVREGDD